MGFGEQRVVFHQQIFDSSVCGKIDWEEFMSGKDQKTDSPFRLRDEFHFDYLTDDFSVRAGDESYYGGPSCQDRKKAPIKQFFPILTGSLAPPLTCPGGPFFGSWFPPAGGRRTPGGAV